MSTFAIGDLHGCPDELEVLLDHLAPTADDTLVFLGDYVDRGAGVRPLVDRLLRLESEGPATIFLRGNHEDMLLDYLGYEGRHGDVYLANGGGATLKSYDVPRGARGAAAAACFPVEHLEFFRRLVMHHRSDGYLYVHAGIRPGRALDEQSDEDLLWIREEFFLHRHDLPYVIVFGHTPQREARVELPFRIGLDTGLVYGNKLSCLDATSRRLIQVSRNGRRAVERDLTYFYGAANL